ncbi:hypothetical protein [Anaeromyxobacter paludicola]|uniref:Cytochrome c family protein n=1 Tax=Anaeromyxobacter paludicola TaxID=2918171 RepID=A0ABM7XBK3_9BACT|nr:hypothetical protein [Anaeromyxobacter paludicola]BDG09239.1 hypothetical protein AMPC_23520 [Anaeromyxobacter paludicola]
MKPAQVLVVVLVGLVGSARAESAASPIDEDRLAFADYMRQLDQLTRPGGGALPASGAAPRRTLAQAVYGDALPAAIAPAGQAAAPPEPRCSLFVPGKEAAAADDCLGCHELHSSHRVDFAYPAVVQRGGALRTAAEAVRRGAFLPEGRVRCGTCHDGRSEYRYHLAIPAGAKLRPAVNPRDPVNHRALAGAPSQPGVLRDVSPTPLCQTCHSYGD